MTLQNISEIHNTASASKAQEIELGSTLYVQAELLKLGLRSFRSFGFFSSTCNAIFMGNGHLTTIDGINAKLETLYDTLSAQVVDISSLMSVCSGRIAEILRENHQLQTPDVDAVVHECNDFEMQMVELLAETKKIVVCLRSQCISGIEVEVAPEILKRNDASILNILKSIEDEMSCILTMMKTVRTFVDGPDQLQNFTEKLHLGGKLKLFWPTEATV